jgi:predicted acyl esterase
VWSLGLPQTALAQLGLSDPCADHAVPTLPAPAAASFTSAPVARPTTIAGPLSAELTLTSTRPDSELIAKVLDVAPDGSAQELTSGELLGSYRATDEALSWRWRDGSLLYPHHPITHAVKAPLTPGQPARMAIAIAPTFHTLQPGHALRLVLTTGETPARFPLPGDLPNLAGGVYTIAHGGPDGARLTVPLLR